MARASLPVPRLSAPNYFAGVALATALGVGIAMYLRPSFAHAVKSLVGLEKIVEPAPESFYAVRVAPVLTRHCTSCHGATRQKAKLRLDRISDALRGGKSGIVIKPGDARNSELYARLILPSSDDRAMPPEGKAPMREDEIEVVRLWIGAGASHVLHVAAIKGAPEPIKEVHFAEVDEATVTKERAPLATQMTQLQARYPGAIAYQSRSSADLEINVSLLGPSFGDADLAALAPLAERIVRADFSGTAITDASASTIARMERLHALRLANTAVTDAMVSTVSALDSLQTLTLIGTAVTAQGFAPLRARGVKVYGGINTTPDAEP